MLRDSHKRAPIAILERVGSGPAPRPNARKDVGASSASVRKNLVSSGDEDESSEGESSDGGNDTDTGPDGNGTSEESSDSEDDS